MNKNRYGFLQKEFPFMSINEIEELMLFSKFKNFSKGSTIIKARELVPDCFYYVFKGVVRGYGFTEENMPVNLYFIENRHYFLAPVRFFQEKESLSEHGFEAVTDVMLLQINYTRLLAKSIENHCFFKLYHDGLKTMLRTFSERIRLMIIADATKRYHYLAEKRPLIVAFAQKKYVAEFLGITPNSFSRILSKKMKKKHFAFSEMEEKVF